MRPLLLLALALSGSLAAQSWYPRHTFTVGGGGAQPQAHLEPLLNNSGVLGIGYGYRFHRYFQADVGLDTIFYAARVRDFLDSRFGPLRIRDYQFLIPVGARAILPVDRGGRFLLSGGGGGARLQYSELLRQPSDYYNLDCYVCNTRGGWGYYGMVAGSIALDRYNHFRVGVIGKVYQGHTKGDPIGAVPPFRTRDRWANVMGEFGFSF